jgi:hypothetical protein
LLQFVRQIMIRGRELTKYEPEGLRELKRFVDNALPLFIISDFSIALSLGSKESEPLVMVFDIPSGGNPCEEGDLQSLKR